MDAARAADNAPALAGARDRFERREWRDAFTMLIEAGVDSLDVEDLERLAVAAYLTGNDDTSDDAWTRAHEGCLRADDAVRAAQCAFWLGWNLMLRGDMARSGGWLSRARRMLDDGGHECAVRGLLLVVDGLEQLESGDPRAAHATFTRAGEIGERFGDRDVVAVSRLSRGESLIAQGDLGAGTACLDEAMVAVVANEVTAPIAGVVYCAVLLECRKIFDPRRAHEWTEAFTRWCDSQPGLVPFRGQCLIHRSEVLQFQGKWRDAIEAARRACLLLAGHPAIGEAYYQQAEMHRLRGEYEAAEMAYRAASTYGKDPQPGLALLRLAQRDVTSALTSIRRVVGEAGAQTSRFSALAASAEISLAAGDLVAAHAAADELTMIASTIDAPMLDALAGHVQGAVLLAEGDAGAALHVLRAALTVWRNIGAPYESARERALIGAAYRQLGDVDSARLEFDAARTAFEDLGAMPDVVEIDALLAAETVQRALPAGLTPREAEVLRLVATGMSNHAIAVELVVSDHTVRRHLQNIYAKAGVSSRAAATAFAFERGLT